ncbi:glycosyltransferase [Bacteroides fragilis]|uniref:glycosyltransferase n=1 Tax=Bacteroides fragilis TaxID=817 RepID=UPI001F17290E|nr:glycosyltransferase [Bacteroides fragilis]MCF2689440.1 glycosyltransferase [Bacteroides fragilis]
MEQPNGHPKVSVIIPVYNTCNYVQEALESICQQTLTDLEIIVIDDGATDGSREVIDKIAATDSRIQVYGQTNQGLSVTRNEGLKYAVGEYIYFMDSDDLLEPDALELCYNKCIAEVLDFVFFDAETFSGEANTANKHFDYKRTSGLSEKTYKGTNILKQQLETYKFKSSVCLNLFRREFISTEKLSFYPGILHEDQLFMAQAYLHASRIGFICRAFFHRRVRTDSIMTRKFTWKNMEGYLTVTNELLNKIPTYPKECHYIISLFLRQMLDAAVWQAHTLPLRQRLKLCLLCLRHYKRYVSTRTLMVLMLKKQKL